MSVETQELVARHETATPMDLLQSAVANGVDADQLEKLMNLQERYMANEARRSFANAMADFQANCPAVLKSKKADRYDYAPLDEIIRTIRPHLDSAGLSVRFSTETSGNIITAICTVAHRDGHAEVSQFAAPVDGNMKVNDTQKMGSANTYARRYALMNALNLVASDEDDDGRKAANPPKKKTRLDKLEPGGYVETKPSDKKATQAQWNQMKKLAEHHTRRMAWLDLNPDLSFERAENAIASWKFDEQQA